MPVVRKNNIRKCQSFVIRNLNGTAKNSKSSEFTNYYKNYDYDYRVDSVARSVYDKNSAVVHMVTGEDVQYIDNFGKALGLSKAESIDRAGTTKTFDVACESKKFYVNALDFIRREAKPLTDKNGENLELQVFFSPKYTKKGILKSFEYVNALFVPRSQDLKIRQQNK